jgi:branched-chain amino acid transport system ATP-binding protein
MGQALLSVRGLSKSFGGLAAVQNVNLDLTQGVITALVGPNGAGKTTVFNLITGNIIPDSGEVLLERRPITATKPHLVAKLGVARSFQDLRLFGKMTVFDNVLVATEDATWLWQPGGRASHRERLARVADALERTGLTHLAKARAVDLSYAETKFLSLARILATGARVWLLDEPSSGLDMNSRARFVKLVRNAVASGVTVCLIEHNLDIVTELADRIAFLDQGCKLAEGEPAAILRNPELIAIYFGEHRP